MRTKVLILVVALIFAGVAAVLALRYVNSARTEIATSSQPIEVLVAQEDIPRGIAAEELAAKEMVALEAIPQRFVAAGAISSPRAIEGQVLSTPLTKGEQLTAGRFEVPSAAGMSYSVTKDQVALAIPTDEVRGVSRFVRPGDHVSMFVSYKNGPDGAYTRLLLPDVKVVAMGGNMTEEAAPVAQDSAQGGTINSGGGGGGGLPGVMTVAVTPDEAEKIIFAEETGSLWLTLLPATSEETPTTPGQTINTVFR